MYIFEKKQKSILRKATFLPALRMPSAPSERQPEVQVLVCSVQDYPSTKHLSSKLKGILSGGLGAGRPKKNHCGVFEFMEMKLSPGV